MSSFKAGAKRRLVLAKTQIVEASPFFLFVGCLLIGVVFAEGARTVWDTGWWSAFAGAIEFIGILFVALEVVTVRKQVGMPGFLQAFFGWLAKNWYFFVRPKPVEIGLSGIASISFVGSGRFTYSSKSNKLSDRIETLERNLNLVLSELDQVNSRFEQSEKSFTAILNEKTQVLSTELEMQKSHVAEISAGGSAFKFVGVLLVLLGVIVRNLPDNLALAPLF
jgi:hypothetical protein